MVKCSKCGAEIKYIPLTARVDALAMAIVDAAYTELINDNGRVIKGHVRHICNGSGNKEQHNGEQCHNRQ